MAHKKWISIAVVGVVAGTTFLIAPAAFAASASGSFAATCDPANYGFGTNGTVYQHSVNGASMSIKQTKSSPVSSSSVTAESQNGNRFTVKTVSDGQTATWTNVIFGQYKVLARRSAQTNCNGVLPGSGNYTFSYTVSY